MQKNEGEFDFCSCNGLGISRFGWTREAISVEIIKTGIARGNCLLVRKTPVNGTARLQEPFILDYIYLACW